VKSFQEDEFGSAAHCIVGFLRSLIIQVRLRRVHLNGKGLDEISRLKDDMLFILDFMNSLKIRRGDTYLPLFRSIANDIGKKVHHYNTIDEGEKRYYTI